MNGCLKNIAKLSIVFNIGLSDSTILWLSSGIWSIPENEVMNTDLHRVGVSVTETEFFISEEFISKARKTNVYSFWVIVILILKEISVLVY